MFMGIMYQGYLPVHSVKHNNPVPLLVFVASKFDNIVQCENEQGVCKKMS